MGKPNTSASRSMDTAICAQEAAAAIETAAQTIRQWVGGIDISRTVAVVLGTGLGGWTTNLQDPTSLPYHEIPGFPVSTVQSHAGALIHGVLDGRPVLALAGRFHLYEGYTPQEVVFGIRTLARLGVKHLVLTNAAGALNPTFDAGGLMVLTDHINATGLSPLRGPNVDAWGPRFPDMSRVYDAEMTAFALEEAARLGIRVERGTYLQTIGPQLETPAETRAYRLWGADAVGMSTVMEAIAARHMGLRLLAISCLTNKNLPDCMAETSIEEIIAMANKSAHDLGLLLAAIIRRMA